ncbi:uncharacterized protein [Rutidosis leptorrhynchoides]|uniref:uncharacterized protein n=1 Tax=Rutidosis leptorrhynchoides TaxID=125765 RepID=UPI003A99871A
MASCLLASDFDSEDVRVMQLIQELDEESEVESVPRIPRVRGYIPRDHESAAQRLWNDYFTDAYPAKKFKRRFRMRINLFLHIAQGITTFNGTYIPEHFDFFRERNDALGRQSFTTLQKCTSAIRQLAYGLSPDAFDEYLHMSSNNDINVLNRSSIFDALKKGIDPSASFEVNGHQYTKGYYLADGIYPDWATLIKGISCPTDEPRIKFTRFQASARKDIERAFGVLQGRIHILSQPSRTLKKRNAVLPLVKDMYLYLHNLYYSFVIRVQNFYMATYLLCNFRPPRHCMSDIRGSGMFILNE